MSTSPKEKIRELVLAGKLRPGDVCFSGYRRSFISRAIMWFTQSWISHSFLIKDISLHEDGSVDCYVIEAGHFEVWMTVFDKYLGPDYKFETYRPLVDVFSVFEALDTTEQYLGKVYGYLQLIGFIPVLVWKWLTGRRIHNPFGQGQICSELVLRYIKKLPVKGYDYLYVDTTSPIDIWNVMSRDREQFGFELKKDYDEEV